MDFCCKTLLLMFHHSAYASRAMLCEFLRFIFASKKIVFFWGLFFFPSTFAADVSTYAARPNQSGISTPPLILLALSLDNELIKEAYSDYADIDGDGQIDILYSDETDYYGYFDANWCYVYASTLSINHFKPVSLATGVNSHFCTTPEAPWSGNFLNWATMTRLDLIRKVLYGGKRYYDSGGLTLLERAEIPFDFHAFSKIYTGPDVNKLTPYTSSAITVCNVNQSPYHESLIRIKTTVDKDWAALTNVRCQGTSVADYNAVMAPCHATLESDNCQYYGSNKKPVGLIQKYQNRVRLGLISGGHRKSANGGLLRKNVKFATDEYDASTGELLSTGAMVNTLDSYRIHEYSYDDRRYNCSAGPLVYCSDWGNPVSEIYHEALRYISGKSSPSSDYSIPTGNDHGLPITTWADPYSAADRCANCAIVVLSTGQNSFDGDNYNNIGDILSGGLTQLNQLTDNIGSAESGLSFPGNFLIGNNGSASVAQCEPKSLASLSQARGICPEIPQYEGSYYVAGLASYARINDLRSDLEGFQNVITYGIEIGQTVPALKFSVPNGLGGSSVVDFSPICQNHSWTIGELVESDYEPCRFLDMDVNSFTYGAGGLLENISLRMGWADERFGGDGDTDVTANFTVTVGMNSLTIQINNSQFRGANTFRLGYSLSGVKDYNGMVLDADYNNFYNSAGGTNLSYDDGDTDSALIIQIGTGNTSGANACDTSPTNCELATPNDVTKSFTVDLNLANVLPKPLLLAAKYGGFTDLDGDGTPEHDADGDGIADDSREWDSKNNRTGAPGADSIPDNYFFSDNSLLLEEQLTRIFQDVENRVSSSSNIALVANSSSGTGTAVQALFRPEVKIKNTAITWVGLLNSLFVDSYGNFREDSDQNGELNDSDFVIKQVFDSSSGQTLVQRYTSADGGQTLMAQGSPVSLEDLKPVWAAHEQLMNVSDVLTQRPYSNTSDTGRHLLTWLDYDADDEVDAGEELPLTTATFSPAYAAYLAVSLFDSDKLIEFIRGEEQPGFRSRSVDYDNDGTNEVWRLGDIVNSSPVQVAEPVGFYTGSRSYNPLDTTFTSFRQYYKDRRRVVYVGSNGGFIHAFNSGFWDEPNQRFLLSNGSESRHPLGGELWAYAPMNLLPHLQWLTDPNYPHVFYMDGQPLIFDANIFPADADHPGGWGTVMVMGMGLGGGEYINYSLIHGTIIRQVSAYVVMDITNPEKPPKLLAEIKHPQLGFTTVKPELIQRRLPSTSGDYSSPQSNDWYLVFGSGPNGTGDAGTRNALDNATSEQSLKLFIYDLKNKSFLSRFNPYDTGITEAYSGDMLVVDWDDNHYDDAVYFGSINTNPLGGALLRINLDDPSPNNWDVSTLLDIGRPITAKPLALTNSDNERWLFSGTGRSLVSSDRLDTAQEYFFGVKEPKDSSGFTYAEVNKSDLINTTSVQVRANGDLSPTFLIKPGVTVNNFEALRTGIAAESGWINDFEYDGTNPSSKSLSSAVSTFSTLFFTEYKPPTDQCVIDGDGFLRAQHYQTGTAVPANDRRLLTEGTIVDSTLSIKRVSIGEGIAPSPIIHRTGDGKTKLIIQGQPGNISDIDLDNPSPALPPVGERQSWKQIHNIPW